MKEKLVSRADKNKSRMGKIINLLKKRYPDARCALNFTSPLELLVATILSAQCTDKRVNRITKNLFRKYRSAEDYASAKPEIFENDIRSAGFYRNKTKSIISCCKEIVEKYKGEVPSTMETLVMLGGIGRKTANVILGNAFGIPGIAVDTHVKRVAYRLALTVNQDPVKIEYDLMEQVPQKGWIQFSHLMIFHGRYSCRARKPLCAECVVKSLCPEVGVERVLIQGKKYAV